MAHKDWTIDDWKRVVWSDETKINIFNSDGRTWTWIRSGESLKSHHVKMTVKHGGGNIMLWSAITYAGVGWMCKINGNMDKTLYKEILEDELERTIEYGTNKLGLERHQVIFQHDNDPKHTTKLVKEYLKEQSYNILEWPAQSSDLNPIENTVGQKTAARNPFFLVFVAHILLQWHELPLFPHSKSSTCREKSERVYALLDKY
ncbi:hypothetical protein G6F48_013005 [Rhizopus delemar]|nr:hypothetical protein G6F48_013005 [Rhizopus delemar]